MNPKVHNHHTRFYEITVVDYGVDPYTYCRLAIFCVYAFDRLDAVAFLT